MQWMNDGEGRKGKGKGTGHTSRAAGQGPRQAGSLFGLTPLGKGSHGHMRVLRLPLSMHAIHLHGR